MATLEKITSPTGDGRGHGTPPPVHGVPHANTLPSAHEPWGCVPTEYRDHLDDSHHSSADDGSAHRGERTSGRGGADGGRDAGELSDGELECVFDTGGLNEDIEALEALELSAPPSLYDPEAILRQLYGSRAVKRRDPLLESFDLEGVARFIQSGQARNIIVMTGAGISVSAGIPDFRTPGTGLYDNLQKYNLPVPESVFQLSFFRENPSCFFTLAKELFPGKHVPTPVHFFIKLLNDKGLLLRNFTQNVDTLERVAGVPGDKLVEAHGSFASAHCIDCGMDYPAQFVKDFIDKDEIARCTACRSLVKPRIVFFGESLPPRFFERMEKDFPVCDLLVVIGTSLMVQPFASLINRVGDDVPRLLINREVVGEGHSLLQQLLGHGGGFDFSEDSNYRDAKYIGSCDNGIWELARLLGWEKELQTMIEAHRIS
eukprot:jgi/Mesvir1/26251/Mv01616-RA.1